MPNIKEGIIQCFSNLGLIVTDEDNFELSEYLTDSILFVSFIIELEQLFDVQISDEYLMQGKLTDFSDIREMIAQLV